MAEFNFNFRVTKSGAPLVTLSSFGLAFNEASRDKLGNPDEIMIGFDPEKKAIGIKAYDGTEDVPKFEFKNKVRNNWVRIGCKDFMRYVFSLVPDIDFIHRGISFVADFNEESCTLIVIVDKDHLKNLSNPTS